MYGESLQLEKPISRRNSHSHHTVITSGHQPDPVAGTSPHLHHFSGSTNAAKNNSRTKANRMDGEWSIGAEDDNEPHDQSQSVPQLKKEERSGRCCSRSDIRLFPHSIVLNAKMGFEWKTT